MARRAEEAAKLAKQTVAVAIKSAEDAAKRAEEAGTAGKEAIALRTMLQKSSGADKAASNH